MLLCFLYYYLYQYCQNVILIVFLNSWKTSQMCFLRTELQAAQLSGGAQGAMSQLPAVHGASEQYVHRLTTPFFSFLFICFLPVSTGLVVHASSYATGCY